MKVLFKLESPLMHPYISVALICIITFIVFFGGEVAVIHLVPLIVYYIFKYKLPMRRFIFLSFIVFIIFFVVNYLLIKDWDFVLYLTLMQALRWCILLFIGLFFDRFISTTSIVFIFYKLRMFNLSIPLLVATRLIPKLKYDIDIGNKAATIRGLRSRSPSKTILRIKSIIFMLLSSTIIFLLEFGTILKIRGIDLPQKRILNRFNTQIFDYILLVYCLAITLIDKLR